MGGRTRVSSEARQTARGQLIALGRELRVARLMSGKRLLDVARAAGLSAVHVSRIERGAAPGVGYGTLTMIAAQVGLKLWLRAFPLGRRSLDAPQLRLFEKLRSRSADSLHWQTEVPIPIPGDLRAADLTTRFGTTLAQVELITRLIDFQAQSRAARLKKRDLSAGRLFLVVSGSHSNRRALAEAEASALASFPLRTREVLEALSAGRDPGADGIVLL